MDDEMNLANEAYDSTQHEDDLAPILEHLDIPQKTKADMWESKRQSRIMATNPKRAKLESMANIPEEVLAKAEAHPNVMKFLMTEEGQQGAGAGASSKGAGPKGEKNGLKKEAGGTKAAGGAGGTGGAGAVNSNNPTEQATAEAGAQTAGLPPMPPGTTHVQASDGSQHYIPHQNLGLAAKRDPGIKILRSS